MRSIRRYATTAESAHVGAGVARPLPCLFAMTRAVIAWVLGLNCHRLICVTESADTEHVAAVYFDGLPIRSHRCFTLRELTEFVENVRSEWRAHGWLSVDVKTPGLENVGLGQPA